MTVTENHESEAVFKADRQVPGAPPGSGMDHDLLDCATGACMDVRVLAESVLGLAEEGIAKEQHEEVHPPGQRPPHKVLALVKQRLDGLSRDCRQFLKVAAILGRSFMLDDVSRILDRSSASLLTSLDESMASGFLVIAGHQFAFRHDFLWQGVIETIPAPARRAMRREAGDHAERRPDPPRETAGTSPGAGPAAHELIMVGEVEAGIAVAREALSRPGTPASDRLEAEASMILGYSLLNRQEAVLLSERILRARRGGSHGDVATMMALTTLSTARWLAGELAEGLTLGRAAARYAEAAPPVWRLYSLLTLAGKLADLREFDQAESLIDEVAAGLRGSPAPGLAAVPAAMRSRLLLQAGQFEEAQRQAESAVSLSGRDGITALRPLALSVLSSAALSRGDLSAAVQHLHRMKEEMPEGRAVLESTQYAWAELRIVMAVRGPRAAFDLLSREHQGLATRRSLYVEEPGAAAFLVRLALAVGDSDLEHSVLTTIDNLASGNPGISVIGLAAMHAHALADQNPAALQRVTAQSPDPFSVALATEDFERFLATHSATTDQSAAISSHSPEEADDWSGLSPMERRIAHLVSLGLTNRQIAKQIHLSAHTVNYHLRKIYKRLDINTRAELARGAAIHYPDENGTIPTDRDNHSS
ncbi:LuxR C-terminal-related transcriptional regulator [Actinocorallia sp. API 0066]|uniref:helix-turn-helix transcriptional regulator n=1 Tax=Actinocorallia sp. API 0066 TaxID=2896846 RepID=UPI001E2AA30F|nr:helix-turn-helix transcriptional regulator [Actinocorallia sp. API 0066]MCD0448642.1 LuxR C-terminal-related transcriptional regulator [Actinocorallia sp. API 0066]